jgi:hypothetical protein
MCHKCGRANRVAAGIVTSSSNCLDGAKKQFGGREQGGQFTWNHRTPDARIKRRVHAAGQSNRINAPASSTRPNNGTMRERNWRCPSPITISDLNTRLASDARTITRQP